MLVLTKTSLEFIKASKLNPDWEGFTNHIKGATITLDNVIVRKVSFYNQPGKIELHLYSSMFKTDIEVICSCPTVDIDTYFYVSGNSVTIPNAIYVMLEMETVSNNMYAMEA